MGGTDCGSNSGDITALDTPDSQAERERLRGMLTAAQAGANRCAPRLVSSHAGAIRRVMLAVPSGVARNLQLSAGYRSLIGALPVGTGFVVVHNRGIREDVEHWFANAGHVGTAVHFVALDDAHAITMWVADGSVAVTDATGRPRLVEPWHFRRHGDAQIADAVAEHTDIKAAHAPLIFHGGNCLAGDDFWLIGRDHMVETARLMEQTVGGDCTVPVETMFRRHVDTDRTLVVLGGNRADALPGSVGKREGGRLVIEVPTDGVGRLQPVFHIDMMVTLLGRDVAGVFSIMVGSPRLADQILGTTSPFALQSEFDAIADTLDALGHRVLRNPIVHRHKESKALPLHRIEALSGETGGAWMKPALAELKALGAGPDDPVVPRYWYHVSWNNCLVENAGPAARRVYLPTYGHGADAELDVIDQHMAELWQSEGFQPVLLGNFVPFAKRQGSLHCIAKVLERGPVPGTGL